MLYYPDRDGTLARLQHEERLAEAAVSRLAHTGAEGQIGLARRGALLAGRVLVALGAHMLRYGRADDSVLIAMGQPGARSATMN
ncbi:MAG: hypothetical protein RLZZ387_1151 [Chloroflexota bacterium]|jgi:hypothetical protein